MLKLLMIAAVASFACRYVFGRWPWDYVKLSPTREQAVLKARKLLAVRPGASRQDVIEAHKRLIAMVHPDRGGTNDQVHEANAARDLLLDEIPD
ncbi:molecular chaperone DnaJ [Novosphingobium sp. TH158]|uniref:molecular chaperone DnaJ n=1 Tax=Novosphingobium sp. TH158 TaxID=2067455 RepID=UPI000C7B9448|nr:molecular chaperone DnaJ [Novosphingobium sp. TH158]PLK26668.1 molecular chaperone DnaJ [Novosphingobium sp. TH158]